jgi:hypothetical protein
LSAHGRNLATELAEQLTMQFRIAADLPRKANSVAAPDLGRHKSFGGIDILLWRACSSELSRKHKSCHHTPTISKNANQAQRAFEYLEHIDSGVTLPKQRLANVKLLNGAIREECRER